MAHAERLRDLYLVTLSREPSAEETAALVAYLEKPKSKKTDAATETDISFDSTH